MEIIDFFASKDQSYWLEEIGKSDWVAGHYLHDLLAKNEFKSLCGAGSKVYLLVEGKELMCFCTYAEQDEIDEPSITPWLGFVYTFPKFRGKRRIGKLLEYGYLLAKEDGFKTVYISTGETGLYEKYGYTFWKVMKDLNGGDTRVYRKEIEDMDYSDIIGKEVSGTIDRPLGSSHPRHPEMIYPINYGYVDGVFAGDGAEQDVYVFGIDEPIETYTGKVIAVYHRINDCEDKWIVSVNGAKPTREEILKTIEFQEQYFCGELYYEF